MFNGIIKEEVIEETDHINNDSKLFQIGYELNLHYSVILNLMIQFLFIYFKHVVLSLKR